MNLGYFLNETKISCLKGMDTKSGCLARCHNSGMVLKKSNVHLPGKMGYYLFIVTPFCAPTTDGR